VHKNGLLRWIRNTPVPRFNGKGELVDYDGLISNITPLKQLEAQLRQAQKMEAVGQLAGGIAHDFNNILTAIIGYGNLLRMKLPQDGPLCTYVEQILVSSERAANLTHSLLAFSRKQIIDLKAIDINAVIIRVERLLQRLIGEDIEFKTVLASGSLPVLADSVQMEQVLMNLATNARDAMPNGGLLLIETSLFEMGEEFQRTHAYGKPGSYALVSITDTGIGMDERTRGKIFDPFFTTKDVGKGTGLGLAMVYGIVKQHSGYINVYSEPGKGTSFKIYLPLTVSLKRALPVEIPSIAHQGTETVLLAEDDAEVRKLTRTVLQDFGYQVIEAVDGEEAVLKFKLNPGAVDLLVFDIIMPRKNGKEAYVEIRDVRPGIKALFMSGYTADVAHKKGILETGLDFVLKPISPTDFLKKVREVLDRR
jgi:signal transduction histidine kinase/CheY-like chemotaxis protein